MKVEAVIENQAYSSKENTDAAKDYRRLEGKNLRVVYFFDVGKCKKIPI